MKIVREIVSAEIALALFVAARFRKIFTFTRSCAIFMTQKELERYLMDAANILRGMIDAADFKQYIFPPLLFKRISDV